MDLHEKVSSLMDGEKVSRRDINDIAGDPQALKDWAGCHLVGDLLRGDVKGNVSSSFMSKFNASFAQEPALPAKRTRKFKFIFSSIRRYAGQTAIAASVALLSVVGVNYYSTTGSSGMDQVLTTTPYGGMASPVRAKIQATPNSIEVVSSKNNIRDQETYLPVDANKVSNHELAQIEALLQDHEFQSRIQRR